MGRFNFRIGTKLGLTAGIGVVLVGGMLTSQLISNEQIAELSRMVVINYRQQGQCPGRRRRNDTRTAGRGGDRRAPSAADGDGSSRFSQSWRKPRRKSTPH